MANETIKRLVDESSVVMENQICAECGNSLGDYGACVTPGCSGGENPPRICLDCGRNVETDCRCPDYD
jgi:hypothetical protein